MDLFKLFGTIAVNRREVEQDLDSVDQKAEGLGNTFGKVFGGLGKAAIAGAAAATTALSGIAIAGTKAAMDFEKGMAEVFTLLPGLSAQARDQMSADVQQFAKEAGVLPAEVIPALYQSISAGVPPDNVFEFLKVANAAAVGGVTDLETAVDGITSVVNAYGADVISAAEASDLMFTAVKLGKTDFEQLSNSLFNVIPTASALGVEFGDVTAAMASMTAQGTPTSVATTQMRQLFVELSKEGTKTSDVFKEIAGKSFKEFIAEGNNTQDALRLLEQHANEAGIGINDLFGSVEAGSAALSLTGKGAESFSANLAEMGDSAGATETAFETMQATVAQQLRKIRANIDVVLIQLGDQFLPILSKLLDWFIEQLPNIQRAVQTGFDIMAAAIGAVIDLVEALRPAFDQLVTWLRRDWTDAEGRTRTFANRMGEYFGKLLEAGRALFDFLVVAWEYQLKPTWEKIEPFVSSLFKALGTIIGGAIDVITSILHGLTAFLSGDFEGAFEHTLDAVRGIWDTLTAVTETVFNGLVAMILNIFGDIPGKIGEIGTNIVEGLTEGITGAAGRAREAVENLGGNVTGWFKDKLGIRSPSTVFAAVGGDIVQGLINGFRDMVSSAREAVEGFAGNVVGWFNRVIGRESPAKEFIAAGKDIIKGLVLGLSDQDSLDALRSNTATVAETIITAFAVALGFEQPKTGPQLWGEAIVQGIIDGIESKFGALEEVVGRVEDVLKRLRLAAFAANPGAFVPTPGVREPGVEPYVPPRVGGDDEPELSPIRPARGQQENPLAKWLKVMQENAEREAQARAIMADTAEAMAAAEARRQAAIAEIGDRQFRRRDGDGGLADAKAAQDQAYNTGHFAFTPRRGDGGVGDLAFTQRMGDRAFRPDSARGRGVDGQGRNTEAHQLEQARIENLKREAAERQKLIEGLTAVTATDGPIEGLGKSMLDLVAQKVPAFGAALQGFAQGGPIGAVAAVFQQLLGESEAFQKILEVVNSLLEPLVKALDALFSALLPIIEVAVNLVHGALQPLTLILEKVVAPVFTFVAKIVAGIWNAIADAINWALGWLGVQLRRIDFEGVDPDGGPPPPSEERADDSSAEARRERRERQSEVNFGGTPHGVQLAVATPMVEAAMTFLNAVTKLDDAFSGVGGRPFELFDDSVERFGDYVTRLVEEGINIRLGEQSGAPAGRGFTAHLRGI